MSVIFGESKKRQLESCPFLGDEAFRGVIIKKGRFIELPSEAFDSEEETTSSIRQGHSLTLTNMFPDIDDKVISDILDHCGDNLNLAIQSLEALKLSSTPTIGTGNISEFHPNNQGPSDLSATTTNTTTANTTNTANTTLPHSHFNIQSLNEDKISHDWIQHMLDDIGKSTSTEEVKERFATQLGLFEMAVIDNFKMNSHELNNVRKEMEQIKKSNTILSKAVAIQHEKLKEASHKDDEIKVLKETLSEYEEKIKNLEFINYSLTMHLQRATEAIGHESKGPPPDIF